MVVIPLFRLPPIPHDDADDLRRFHPPSPTVQPKDLYYNAMNGCSIPALRYIRIDNSREMLIYIDGACSNNGTPQARAGYGAKWTDQHKSYYRLEGTGPETSNRAELHAAVVALGLKVWSEESFNKIVLAYDLENVVKGISE